MKIYIIREDRYHYGSTSNSSIVNAYKKEADALKHLSDGIDTKEYPVMRTAATKQGYKVVIHSKIVLGGSYTTVPTYSVARYIEPVELI